MVYTTSKNGDDWEMVYGSLWMLMALFDPQKTSRAASAPSGSSRGIVPRVVTGYQPYLV